MQAAAPLPGLEFSEYYRRETRWSSVLMFVYVGINFLVANTYRHWFLGLTEPAPGVMWLLEYGIIAPCCFAAAYIRYRCSESPLATRVTIAAMVIVAAAIIAVRYVWVRQGMIFFSELNAYFFIGAIAMTGIEYHRLLAIAMPILLIETAVSYKLYGWGPKANFEVLSFATAGFIIFIVGWQVERSMRRTWLFAKGFERQAQVDPLTGLLNRRAFEERARQALRHAIREKRSVALAVLDLDDFKPFNDRYGHPAGDLALAKVGHALAHEARRPMDLVARIGGEEFVILWFDIDREAARRRCDAVTESVRRLHIRHEASRTSSCLTVSVGAVHLTADAAARTAISDLVNEADGNLYKAKQNGRNCVILPAPDPAAGATP